MKYRCDPIRLIWKSDFGLRENLLPMNLCSKFICELPRCPGRTDCGVIRNSIKVAIWLKQQKLAKLLEDLQCLFTCTIIVPQSILCHTHLVYNLSHFYASSFFLILLVGFLMGSESGCSILKSGPELKYMLWKAMLLSTAQYMYSLNIVRHFMKKSNNFKPWSMGQEEWQ